MNAQPKYPTKGPGDLTGPGDPQNEPLSTGSVLECPNETGTWLAENMAEELLSGAAEIIGDFITGFQDIYARNKLQRQIVELAQRCESAIRKAESDENRNGEWGKSA